MNELAAWLSSTLLRTTIALSVAFAIGSVLLWLTSCRSPGVRRAIWIIVLLQGWMIGRYALAIPWYEVQTFQAHVVVGDPLLEGAMPSALGPQRQLPVAARDDRLVEQTPVTERAAGSILWNWQSVLGLAWLLGGLVIVLHWAADYWRFVRNVPLGEAASADDEEAWRRLLAEREVAEAIPLRMTESVGPLLCRVPSGYCLLAPRAFWQELSNAARLAVLRHELAHYERGDAWKSLLARLLVLPHWFNPLAWRALHNFEEAAEWACDDAVRRDCPDSAPLYGRILLALGAAQTPRTILNNAARGHGLGLRIRRIAAPNLTDDSRMKKACLLGAALALLLAGGAELKLSVQNAAAQGRAKGDAKSEVRAKAAQVLLQAARKTSEITTKEYDEGTVTLTMVYVWSRRLLDAERALAKNQQEDLEALQDHRQRMQRLLQKTKALHEKGARGGEEQKLRALEYYVAEVELWIIDAGGEATNNDAE
ncbi:MAG TPA: M56 family metallopeptidase [Pirellulales bacterium]|nr:M56 family metallopeptidase [Pirellulales bacterium]